MHDVTFVIRASSWYQWYSTADEAMQLVVHEITMWVVLVRVSQCSEDAEDQNRNYVLFEDICARCIFRAKAKKERKSSSTGRVYVQRKSSSYQAFSVQSGVLFVGEHCISPAPYHHIITITTASSSRHS